MSGPPVFSPRHLEQTSAFIAEHLGLFFPRERWPVLNRNLCELAAAVGFDDAQACVAWLTTRPATPERLEALARHMTVGESYFFRDEAAFSLFSDVILPERMGAVGADQARRLRIWSAGCSSGEEPYSLAMAVDRAPGLEGWDVTILGSDINPEALAKARRGIYSPWSLRQLLGPGFAACFTRTQTGAFQLDPKILQRVDFRFANLAAPSWPTPPFWPASQDVIFCRNVLMYFDEGTRYRILHRFAGLLRADGWLMVGPSESAFMRHPDLTLEQIQGVFVLRKRPRAGPGRAPTPTTLPPEGAPPPLPTCPIAPAPEDPAQRSPEEISLEEARLAYESGHYAQTLEKLAPVLAGGDLLTGRGAKSIDMMALAARTFANLGQLEQAMAWIERAVEIDRLNASHYYFAATVLQASGDHPKAREWLRKTLYVDPGFILAHLCLGNLTTGQREGVRHLKQALKLVGALEPEEAVPHSDGIPARQMRGMIQATLERVNG